LLGTTVKLKGERDSGHPAEYKILQLYIDFVVL